MHTKRHRFTRFVFGDSVRNSPPAVGGTVTGPCHVRNPRRTNEMTSVQFWRTDPS